MNLVRKRSVQCELASTDREAPSQSRPATATSVNPLVLRDLFHHECHNQEGAKHNLQRSTLQHEREHWC